MRAQELLGWHFSGVFMAAERRLVVGDGDGVAAFVFGVCVIHIYMQLGLRLSRFSFFFTYEVGEEVD